MGRAGAAISWVSLRAGEGVHALYPGAETGSSVAVALAVPEDQGEELVVLWIVQRGELQEREGADVGGGERVADEVRGVGEHLLEAVERAEHLVLELAYEGLVRMGLAELRLDLVRRALPALVEPVDEVLDLVLALVRVERRV